MKGDQRSLSDVNFDTSVLRLIRLTQKLSTANTITLVAPGLGTVGWEAWNETLVLFVESWAKESNTGDSFLDFYW